MRLTLRVANREGVKASLRQYSAAAVERAKAAMQESGQECLNLAAGLCAFRSGFMLSNLRLVFSRTGLAFSVGFFAPDFIGKIYPLTGRPIRVFYPKFVVNGTRHQAAQDNLTPALEGTRGSTRRRVAVALSPIGRPPRGLQRAA